jgi:hypothetical protein
VNSLPSAGNGAEPLSPEARTDPSASTMDVCGIFTSPVEEAGRVRQAPDDATDETCAGFARFLLDARRDRRRYFPAVEFSEPVWDMVLDLFVSDFDGHKVSISSLCVAAGIPESTALRWIGLMQAAGYFIRHPDPYDGRRSFITLSPGLSDPLRHYLVATRRMALRAIR